MTFFPNIKWLRKLAGENSNTSKPKPPERKPSLLEIRQQTHTESSLATHKWTRQDTKSKIAEARKKWTWHESEGPVGAGHGKPPSEVKTSKPRRPVFRTTSDLSAARVVKSSQTSLREASENSRPATPPRSRASSSSRPLERNLSQIHPLEREASPPTPPLERKSSWPSKEFTCPDGPRYVKAPPPAKEPKPNLRKHAIRNNTYAGPEQKRVPSLRRMASVKSVKSTLKRSASAMLPRGTRPSRSDSHHETSSPIISPGISSPYSYESWDLPSSTVPNWRYEDLPPEVKDPMYM